MKAEDVPRVRIAVLGADNVGKSGKNSLNYDYDARKSRS